MSPLALQKSSTARRPAASARQGQKPAPAAEVLENGDRLTAAEFLRRYETLRGLRKAQLIEGIVYMPSPVRAEAHAEPDGILHIWLGTYALSRTDLKFYPNATLILDADNAVQPDAMLCTSPHQKGSPVRLDDKGYLCGAPELVCEVAASTAPVDLHEKLRAYRRNGISEYLIWLTGEKRVLWYHLENQEYVEMKETGGRLSSRAFPGLALDVKALVKMDARKVMAALVQKK